MKVSSPFFSVFLHLSEVLDSCKNHILSLHQDDQVGLTFLPFKPNLLQYLSQVSFSASVADLLHSLHNDGSFWENLGGHYLTYGPSENTHIKVVKSPFMGAWLLLDQRCLSCCNSIDCRLGNSGIEGSKLNSRELER